MKKSVSAKVLKRLGLFLLLALAVVLIVRCEKDPVVVIPTQYVIDASTGPGGTFLPKVGQILIEKGKDQSLTPKSYDGYELETMTVDGNDVTKLLVNGSYPFTEVVSNHTAHATFKKIVIVMHSVEILPTVGGTVTSNLSQVGDGLGVTLTFTADPGFKTDSVIINGVSFPLTGNTYNLTNITSDPKVKGVFGKMPLWNLIQKPWKTSKYEARAVNTTDWYIRSFDIETYTFGTNGWFTILNSQSVQVGHEQYTLTADSLLFGNPKLSGGVRNKIIQMDGDTLKLRLLSKYVDYSGKPDSTKDLEIQYTYIHP